LTSILIAVALILTLFVAWLLWRGGAAGQRAETNPTDNLDTVAAWAPQATRVLTTAERKAYDTLRMALPAHTILAQVPLARFIKVPTRNSYAEWLRRVGHLCADLVVCDRHAQVIAVVEIYPANEQPDPRVLKRRNRLARVLKAAEIPLHVWPEEALPSVNAAREALAPAAEEVAPAVPAAGAAAFPGAHAMPDVKAPAGPAPALAENEPVVLRDPPPETWFDDFDSGAAPLDNLKPTQNRR